MERLFWYFVLYNVKVNREQRKSNCNNNDKKKWKKCKQIQMYFLHVRSPFFMDFLRQPELERSEKKIYEETQKNIQYHCCFSLEVAFECFLFHPFLECYSLFGEGEDESFSYWRLTIFLFFPFLIFSQFVFYTFTTFCGLHSLCGCDASTQTCDHCAMDEMNIENIAND